MKELQKKHKSYFGFSLSVFIYGVVLQYEVAFRKLGYKCNKN